MTPQRAQDILNQADNWAANANAGKGDIILAKYLIKTNITADEILVG